MKCTCTNSNLQRYLWLTAYLTYTHTYAYVKCIYLKCLTHFGNLHWAPPLHWQACSHTHTHPYLLRFTHSRTHACRFALVILPFWCSSRQFDFLLFLLFQANRKSLSAFVAAGCCCLCCLFFLRALCFPIRLLTIKSKIASGISFSQTLKENRAQISAAQP